jgi:glycosyltransferase involved in cell wall biosynthesis
MKILFLVDDFLPHSTKVAAKMMHELALEFNANGHEITVMTPHPKLKQKLKEKRVDGVNVLFFKSGKVKNTSKIRRAINEFLFSYNAWRAGKKYLIENKQDAIVYYSPSIFWGLFVGRLKKLWEVKSYLTFVHKFFKHFESLNYHNADHIGVMSPSSLYYFRNRKDYNKCEVLFNWSKNQNNAISAGKIRNELNLKGKVVFFYGGNIGKAQNMLNLVKLAIRFKSNKNVHFLFVGQGDEVELVKLEKEKHQIDNLTYLPPVSQEDYFQMLNEFDIGLFSLHPKHSTNNFPGKLLGYMQLRKPILGSVNAGNDLKEIVNEAGAGYIFDNGEDDELYKAALKLAESEELRIEIGKKGQILLADVFSVEKACSLIANKIL